MLLQRHSLSENGRWTLGFPIPQASSPFSTLAVSCTGTGQVLPKPYERIPNGYMEPLLTDLRDKSEISKECYR